MLVLRCGHVRAWPLLVSLSLLWCRLARPARAGSMSISSSLRWPVRAEPTVASVRGFRSVHAAAFRGARSMGGSSASYIGDWDCVLDERRES